MVTSTSDPNTVESDYDRLSEIIAFDESKAGVKGLVDAGISKIPRMFIQPPDSYGKSSTFYGRVPTIDLDAIDRDADRRNRVINEIKDASKNWGFFQIINHGIPLSILEEMLNGARRFFEQDTEVKKVFYTRDHNEPVRYNSNFDLYISPAANWRDTVGCFMAPSLLDPEKLPAPCRYVYTEPQRLRQGKADIIFPYKAAAHDVRPCLTEDKAFAYGPGLALFPKIQPTKKLLERYFVRNHENDVRESLYLKF